MVNCLFVRCHWQIKDIVEIQNYLFVQFFLKEKLPKSLENFSKDSVVFILTQEDSAALNAYICLDSIRNGSEKVALSGCLVFCTLNVVWVIVPDFKGWHFSYRSPVALFPFLL